MSVVCPAETILANSGWEKRSPHSRAENETAPAAAPGGRSGCGQEPHHYLKTELAKHRWMGLGPGVS